MSKHGVISGPNTGKYGPEITPYLDTFHAVQKLVFRGVLKKTILESFHKFSRKTHVMRTLKLQCNDAYCKRSRSKILV